MTPNQIIEAVQSRDDGYSHIAVDGTPNEVALYDLNTYLVTTYTIVTEAKIEQIEGYCLQIALPHPSTLGRANKLDAYILLAQHFPIRWKEISDPTIEVSEQTALIWQQFASGVKVDDLIID